MIKFFFKLKKKILIKDYNAQILCHDINIDYKNAQKNRMEIEFDIIILFKLYYNYTVIK